MAWEVAWRGGDKALRDLSRSSSAASEKPRREAGPHASYAIGAYEKALNSPLSREWLQKYLSKNQKKTRQCPRVIGSAGYANQLKPGQHA
jgi:hypothetical protein